VNIQKFRSWYFSKEITKAVGGMWKAAMFSHLCPPFEILNILPAANTFKGLRITFL